MKIIKINNNNVELLEGTLLIPEFEDIYESNKNYIDCFKVIVLYADLNSPYKNYTEEQRIIKLENDFKVKIDDKILVAIEKYKEMCYSQSMRYLQANQNALNKTIDYLNNVDYTLKDVKGNFLHDIKKVTDTISNCGKILTALTNLEEKVFSESLIDSKVRGNAQIRKREE